MKAFKIRYPSISEGYIIYPAYTSGKARYWAYRQAREAGYGKITFADFYVYRCPEFDNLAEKFNEETGWNKCLGWWESEESSWGCCNKDMIGEYFKNG